MAAFSHQKALLQAYFTTTVQPNDPNSASVLPNSAGVFSNDFSAVQTNLVQKFGSFYEAYVAEAKTFFIRKDIFSNNGAYQVFVSYVDGNGDVWSIAETPTPTPIVLPWKFTASVAPSFTLYKNGDSTSTVSPYRLVFPSSWSYVPSLVPSGTPTTAQFPTMIFLDINVLLSVAPSPTPVVNTYYFLHYVINNDPNATFATSSIPVVLPAWLAKNYWVQIIFATENLSPNQYSASLGGWPNTTSQLWSALYADDQELFPMDGTLPTGTPSAFLQIELSCLDVSYIGNQSSGRILDTFSFSDLPNDFTFERTPNFRRQTLQGATDINGKSIVQYGITDRNGQPYLTFLALYDVSSQVIIEASRRTNGLSLQTQSGIY